MARLAIPPFSTQSSHSHKSPINASTSGFSTISILNLSL